jgi:hypothetical protein
VGEQVTYTVTRVGADGYPISPRPKPEEFTAASAEVAAQQWFALVVKRNVIDPDTLLNGVIHCRVTDNKLLFRRRKSTNRNAREFQPRRTRTAFSGCVACNFRMDHKKHGCYHACDPKDRTRLWKSCGRGSET